MIVSFLEKYLDEEDRERRGDLKTQADTAADEQTREKSQAEYRALDEKAIAAYLKIYTTPEAILDELQETINQVEKKDFTDRTTQAAAIAEKLLHYDKSGEDGNPAELDSNGESLNPFIAYFQGAAVENFDNFEIFLMTTVIYFRLSALGTLRHPDIDSVQLDEILQSEEKIRISTMVVNLYLSFYPEAEDIPPEYIQGKRPPILAKDGKASYLPMFHSKITDALAAFSKYPPQLDRITKNAIFEKEDVKLLVREWAKLNASLSINTHKLLSVGVMLFTMLNNSGARKTGQIEYGVSIPLEEYINLSGRDLEALEGDEKKRQSALKEARKKIRKDLAILANSELTVKEKNGEFINVKLVGTHGIKNGYIFLTIDPAFAACLLKLPIMQYPLALLGIDARNANAYVLGCKIAEHFSIYNNQLKGTADLLTVKSLLKATQLPTISEVRAKRKSWEERIKEPFETALELLKKNGVITDWEYCKTKGEPLTDQEAAFTNKGYEDWAACLVKYSIIDKDNMAKKIIESLERSQERQQKRLEKGTKKKK